MSNVKMSEEEQAYLQSYDISQYERPSVAADMAVFSIMETGEINEEKRTKRKDNYRKDPEKKL